MIYDFKQGYNDNKEFDFTKRPIIAISANIIDENSALHFAYSKAVSNAGGVPIIVAANASNEAITSLMASVDGLLFSGGADIDANYFNEENLENLTKITEQRDTHEFALLRAALDASIPILGICRGCQLINVALGGTLYQDLPTQFPTTPLPHSILINKHLPVHGIEIEKDSTLYNIVGKTKIGVNSRHHQAIKDIASGLKITARSEDGVIEAVEAYPNQKIIALQCHPENLATQGNSIEMQRLFSFFISEAQLYSKAKEIHTLNPIIDSHCDTPMRYDEGGFDFAIRNSGTQVDLVKMRQGYLDSTITVAYISQRTEADKATDKAFSILQRFKKDIENLDNKIIVANSVQKVIEAKTRGKKSVMLGLENGFAIGNDLENIDKLKQEGILYITLCHNGANQICDSAVGDTIYNGVSEFGKKVIERMNNLGITIDISHSSEQSTLDALKLSLQPIIASHSSCKALCNHPRNLSDEYIRLIAQNGGVVQVCAYNYFLKEDGEATIHDVVQHIEHIVSLTGYNYVGVGSDFDGGGGVPCFQGANDFINLTIELLRRGHSAENIAKIMGGNILRVLQLNSKN